MGVGSGQTPEPEDAAEMKDNLAPTIAYLFERRVVDARFILDRPVQEPIIPDAWFIPLSRCLAFFGSDEVMSADYQILAAVAQSGQDALHEMADTTDATTPVKACYF